MSCPTNGHETRIAPHFALPHDLLPLASNMIATRPCLAVFPRLRTLPPWHGQIAIIFYHRPAVSMETGRLNIQILFNKLYYKSFKGISQGCNFFHLLT